MSVVSTVIRSDTINRPNCTASHLILEICLSSGQLIYGVNLSRSKYTSVVLIVTGVKTGRGRTLLNSFLASYEIDRWPSSGVFF